MTETLPQLSFASPSPWCKPTDATRRRCSAGVMATASPAAGGHARRGSRPPLRWRRRRCARRAGGAASGWQRDAVHTGSDGQLMGNAVAPNQWLSRPPPVAGEHARRGSRPPLRWRRRHARRGGRASILCTACRPILHQVRKSSTLPPSTGRVPDLSMSGNRPPRVHAKAQALHQAALDFKSSQKCLGSNLMDLTTQPIATHVGGMGTTDYNLFVPDLGSR